MCVCVCVHTSVCLCVCACMHITARWYRRKVTIIVVVVVVNLSSSCQNRVCDPALRTFSVRRSVQRTGIYSYVVCKCVCMCVKSCVYMYVCLDVCVYVQSCLSPCVSMCVCVCVCTRSYPTSMYTRSLCLSQLTKDEEAISGVSPFPPPTAAAAAVAATAMPVRDRSVTTKRPATTVATAVATPQVRTSMSDV
eukprot:GHVU01060510.1.p2 GENE.GHVU01060510.1~~GHVU01060510.1.p2  ORF type:complete len:193 (+),score=8.40 GHVU01060510.1:220-798(+)